MYKRTWRIHSEVAIKSSRHSLFHITTCATSQRHATNTDHPQLRSLHSYNVSNIRSICIPHKNSTSIPRKARIQPIPATINGANIGGNSSTESIPQKIRSFLDTNFIAVSLLSATTLGWLFPGPGTIAAAYKLQTFSTIGIFIISGILLQRGEAVAALRSPLALIYGIAAILFFSPMLAIPILNIPFQPAEIGLGLAVFCCVPTTLSTCVTLTNACRGNAAIALLLVVVTNIIGVFTIPAVLSVVLGASAASTSFQPFILFKNLVLTVLMPLLVGVAAQLLVPGVPDWRTRNRKLLSYMSTFFLCLVPWMQLSVAASSNLALTPLTVAIAAATGALLHIVLLLVNITATSFLTFNQDRDENIALRKAVVLCTSEKTLPVAVAVLNQLSHVSGAAIGFAVVPCVLAHIVQIAIDSAIVGRWNKRESDGRVAIA